MDQAVVLIDLDSTISRVDQIEIYRMLHPTSESTFFSSLHGTFLKTDWIGGHKTHLNNLRLEVDNAEFSLSILPLENRDD